MITILISNPHEFPVSESRVADALRDFLESKNIKNAEVSVKIANKEEMLQLAKTHLKEEDVLHNVLSFTYSEVPEGTFVDAPDGITRLGDIAVCFEKAQEEAKEQGRQTEDWVIELTNHGALHLLGIHHD